MTAKTVLFRSHCRRRDRHFRRRMDNLGYSAQCRRDVVQIDEALKIMTSAKLPTQRFTDVSGSFSIEVCLTVGTLNEGARPGLVAEIFSAEGGSGRGGPDFETNWPTVLGVFDLRLVLPMMRATQGR